VFRKIAEAYAILSNEKLKTKFDRGEDVTSGAKQDWENHYDQRDVRADGKVRGKMKNKETGEEVPMDFDVHEKGKEPPPPPPPDPCVKHRCVLTTGMQEGEKGDPKLEAVKKKEEEEREALKKRTAQQRTSLLHTRSIESSAAGNAGKVEKVVNIFGFYLVFITIYGH